MCFNNEMTEESKAQRYRDYLYAIPVNHTRGFSAVEGGDDTLIDIQRVQYQQWRINAGHQTTSEQEALEFMISIQQELFRSEIPDLILIVS